MGDDRHSVLRRGRTVWDPRSKRWVVDKKSNVDNIRRTIRERDTAARRRGKFYNQVSGKSEKASLKNIQSYGRRVSELRIQDAMANMDYQADKSVAERSLRVLQKAEQNGSLYGLIGMVRNGDNQIIVTTPNLVSVRNAMKLFAGERVRFEYGYDQENPDPHLVRDEVVDIGARFSRWWSSWSTGFYSQLLESSSVPIFEGQDWPVRITRLHDVSGVGQDDDGGEGGEDDDVDSNASNDQQTPPSRPRHGTVQGSGINMQSTLPTRLVDKILYGLRNHANQRYLDSKHTHCVLGPIVDYFETRLQSAVEAQRAAETLVMWEDGVQKARAWLERFEGEGLSEKDLLAVASDLKIHIVIHLPLQPGGPTHHTFDTHGRVNIKRVVKVFHFVNVRFDHLEPSLNRCVTKRSNVNDITWVTTEKIVELRREFDDKDVFYMFRQGQGVLKSLVTLEHCYQLSGVHALYFFICVLTLGVW